MTLPHRDHGFSPTYIRHIRHRTASSTARALLFGGHLHVIHPPGHPPIPHKMLLVQTLHWRQRLWPGLLTKSHPPSQQPLGKSFAQSGGATHPDVKRVEPLAGESGIIGGIQGNLVLRIQMCRKRARTAYRDAGASVNQHAPFLVWQVVFPYVRA